MTFSITKLHEHYIGGLVLPGFGPGGGTGRSS